LYGLSCFQSRDAKLKTPDFLARLERHYKGDDGDDRNRQNQKRKAYDFRHCPSPGSL
jgi:hypothetical protein